MTSTHYELTVNHFYPGPCYYNEKSLGVFATEDEAKDMLLQHVMESNTLLMSIFAQWKPRIATWNESGFEEYRLGLQRKLEGIPSLPVWYSLYEFAVDSKSQTECIYLTEFIYSNQEKEYFDLREPQHKFSGLKPKYRKFRKGSYVRFEHEEKECIGIVTAYPKTPREIAALTKDSYRNLYVNRDHDDLYTVFTVDGDSVATFLRAEKYLTKPAKRVDKATRVRLSKSFEFAKRKFWDKEIGDLSIHLNPLLLKEIKEPHVFVLSDCYEYERTPVVSLKSLAVLAGTADAVDQKSFKVTVGFIKRNRKDIQRNFRKMKKDIIIESIEF